MSSYNTVQISFKNVFGEGVWGNVTVFTMLQIKSPKVYYG